jgi:hypothetical protein|tara:strand:- start:2076 stop:2324 length:249 start_codon:yes stop_codon:yes gene_type:complete
VLLQQLRRSSSSSVAAAAAAGDGSGPATMSGRGRGLFLTALPPLKRDRHSFTPLSVWKELGVTNPAGLFFFFLISDPQIVYV